MFLIHAHRQIITYISSAGIASRASNVIRKDRPLLVSEPKGSCVRER